MSTKGRFKIVLIGDTRVGKTSLRKRFMGESFAREYTQTLGADFSIKNIFDNTITIYDLAGDEFSRPLREQYYYGTQGIIMVFDVSNRSSFENLENWLDEIRSILSDKLRIFILGNKDDLRSIYSESVDEDEAYALTRKWSLELDSSISYLSTSALTGHNVETAFTKLISEIIYN